MSSFAIVRPAVYQHRGSSDMRLAQAGLALIIFAAPLKGNPLLAGLPFDLTVVVGLPVAFLIAIKFLGFPGRKLCFQVVWMLPLFAGIALCGLWTEWTPYAVAKTLRLFLINLPLTLLPALAVSSVEHVKRFVHYLMIMSAIVCSGAPFQLQQGNVTDRATGLVGVTITLGLFAGIVFVGLYAQLAPESGAKRWRALLCIPFLLVMVAAGSRGPLVFSLLTALFLTLRWSVLSFRALLAMVVMLLAAGYFMTYALPQLPTESVSRIQSFMQMQMDSSEEERMQMGHVALSAIPEHPFGLGIGGFGKIYPHDAESFRIYPHNLLLELAVENGWAVALGFIAIAVTAVLRSYKAATQTAELRPFFAILLLTLLETLVSGNASDQRHVFCLLAIGLQMPVLMKQQRMGE